MKILLATLALAFAAPVAAQTAPAQPGHDQHWQHQQHQPGQHQPAQHQQHGDGCCADRNGNGRMDCCEQAAQAGRACGCCDEQPAQRR